MKRIERCEYGRINAEKRKNIIGALSMVAIGVAIFILGLCLNKFEKTNIFTVVAVLFVLPMARYLTTVIVLLPYKTPDKVLYEQVKSVVPQGSILFSDYVFTSGERAMGMSFFALTGNELIGLAVSGKEKTEKMKEYLSAELKRRAIPGKVIIHKEQDKFLSALKKIDVATRTETEMQELVEFLRSLAV